MDDHETQPAGFEDGAGLTGTLVGRYVIHERIGVGGLGEVYRAEDRRLKRTVAIKRVGARFRKNPVYQRRLVKEARHASVLNDPLIAAVYDVVTTDDESFLVMEFVDGKKLREFVTGAISNEDFSAIARQCLNGLAAAHRRGVVHRDIKPENILVTAEKRIKICDFGLARLTPQEGVEQGTITQGISGTPAYMAPEAHMGSVFDPRSDVFSLGTVLFELWTGRRPFSEEAFRMSLGLSGVPLQPAAARPGLDPDFNRVVQRMLSFSPANRYADATEALEDLDREAPETEIKKRRNRHLVALVTAGILAITAAVGFRFLRSTTPEDTGPASVLLADFENKSGDPYYDLTVSQLFDLAMEQSQYLNVMSRYRVSEAMARSGVPAGSVVTETIGLDLARREHAKFVLSGEVQKEAQRVLLTLQATRTDSGKTSQVFSEPIRGPSELPAAVQSLTRAVRVWLGEPLPKVNQTNARLDQVTTHSAVAWERFSQAIQTDSLGPDHLAAAATLLKFAVDADPDFAMAHEQLAVMQSRLGNLADSRQSIQRAYDLSSQVTEREKYEIIGAYHDLRYEFDLAMEAFRTLTVLYPYDDVAHRHYAQMLSNMLAAQDSISAARKAVALNPSSTLNTNTLANSLALGNRSDDVISLFNQLRSSRPTALDVSEGNAWLAKADFVRSREIFEQIAKEPESRGDSGRLQLAKVLIYEGKLGEAGTELDADLLKDLQLKQQRFSVQRRNWLGWIRVLQGNRPAVRNAAWALLRSADRPLDFRELRELGVMVAEIGDAELADEILKRLEGFVQSGLQGNVFKGAADHIRGDMARARSNKDLARDYLNQASASWVDVLTLWSMARVSEDFRDFQSASTFYRQILDREGEIIRLHFPGFKALALAGAARCELALGHAGEARNYYDEFFKTLGKYSPNLTIIKEARQNIGRLPLN
jgi:serine/threonine protein kinase